jgi:malate dehydrogenase
MFASRTAFTNLVAKTFVTRREMSTKVAVLGAAGGIGQPLSMLMKLSPEVDELACYDVVGTPGVAADLSHVSYNCKSYELCCSFLEIM